MPCFHLNLIAEDVMRDEEGHDLPTLDAAIQIAVTSGRELIADHIVSGETVRLSHRIEIADHEGRTVHIVRFGDVVDIKA